MSKINEELAKEKGLDETRYNKLSKKYKYLLEYYLNAIVDFKKYDEEIRNNDLYIGPNLKYKSLNEFFDFDYIFFLNDLFIEKLSIDDISLLENSNINDPNSKIMEMIDNTYRNIIKNNYNKGKYLDLVYKVCYGPIMPSNFVNNDSLVFKIYYGKNVINVDDKDYIELRNKQIQFLSEIINKIKKEVKEKTNVDCEILIEKDIY